MADNGIGENENLNSARAVKPGSLFSDMSRFANLTQEEASYETLDKVQSIDDRLGSIEDKLDRIANISKSVNDIYEIFKQANSALQRKRTEYDRNEAINNRGYQQRIPAREAPTSVAYTPTLAPVLEVNIDGLKPTLEIGFSSVVKAIGVSTLSLMNMVGSGVQKMLPAIKGGVSNIVPQIVNGVSKNTLSLAYNGQTTALTSSIRMEPVIGEEELGNVWEEVGIDADWSNSVITSIDNTNKALLQIAGSVGTLLGITQKSEAEEQDKELIAAQSKTATMTKALELPLVQIGTELPEKAKSIGEWLGRLVGFSDTTIGFLAFVSGFLWKVVAGGFNSIMKGLKGIGDWFLSTRLGKSLTEFGRGLLKDIRVIGRWLRMKWYKFTSAVKIKIGSWFDDAVKGIGSYFDDFIKWVGNTKVGKAFNTFKGYIDDALKGVWVAFKNTKVGQFLTKSISKIGGFFSKFGDGVLVFFQKMPFFKNTAKWIEGIFGGAGKGLLGGKMITATAGKTIGKATEIAGKTGGKLFGKVLPALGAIISAYEAIRRFVEGDYLGAIIEVVGGIASFIPGWGTVVALVAMGVNLIRDNWDSIIEFLETSVTSIGMFISDTWKSIKDWFTETTNSVTRWVAEVTEPYVEGFNKLYDWISEWVVVLTDTFVGTIKDAWYGLSTSFKDAAEYIWNGITSFASSLYETVREYIMNWFGIDITAVFVDLKNKVVYSWNKGKEFILAIPDYAKKVWATAKEYINSGLVLAGEVAEKAWKTFTDPIKTAWNSFMKGVNLVGESLASGFIAFQEGLESVAKWLEGIDPWEEIEKSFKKITELFEAIPKGINAVYDKIIGNMPKMVQQALGYESGTNEFAKTTHEISAISDAKSGQLVQQHKETIAELAKAREELESLESWTNTGILTKEADILTAKNKITALERKSEMEMRELYKRRASQPVVSGSVQAQTVQHAQIAPLTEVKYAPESITAVPMEAQKMEKIQTAPQGVIAQPKALTQQQIDDQLAEIRKNIQVYNRQESTISNTANGVTTITKTVTESGDKSLYSGVSAEPPMTNRNAELLYETVKQQIADNGSTIGNCAKAINDATIAIGASNERGHAYEKIAQLSRNKNFEDITSQYKTAEDLRNLPKGAIVVWDKSKDKQYGHISVADGKGGELSDHYQKQTIGFDKKGRAYGAYHVYMPKADAKFNAPQEKGYGQRLSEWLFGSSENEALKANTEALKENTDSTEANSEAYDHGVVGKAIDFLKDSLTAGLAYTADKGAKLVDWLDGTIMGSDVPTFDQIVGGMKKMPVTTTGLAMVSGAPTKEFEIPVESEVEDNTNPVVESPVESEVEDISPMIESPLPVAEANRKAEEERIIERSQRPVTVVAPPIAQTPQNEQSSNTTSPSLDDAIINDIRLLAINQGLC